MHTYILHADLHKELLTQNRIDPITGDAIQEGDEVVFCAGCKSIFLKDTWEYLGKKHCNQSQTLRNFPFSSTKLKLGNDILYYQSASGIKMVELEITPKMKGWVYKENNTGKYHNYLFGEKEYSFKSIFYVLSFALLLLLNIIFTSQLIFFFSFIFVLGAYPFIKYLKMNEYKKKLISNYKKITEQSFLIKPNGIAVCSAYGIKEVFLHSKQLKAVTLVDLGGFFKSEVIFEYQNKTIKVPVRDYPLENDSFYFTKALARLSIGLNFPITLFIKNENRIKLANQLIEEIQAKFTIESRDEYLKQKYEYLYNYKEKIQKILS